MAKISKIAKNDKRKKIVTQFAARKTELKKIINSPGSSVEQVDEAVMKLQKLPRDASASRVRNRCTQCSRSRGNLRKFGLCRIDLRGLALQGQIPGVVKSSW